MEQVIEQLNKYLQGWMGYFKLVETKTDFNFIDKWLRCRLRCLQWKQWGRRGYRELRKRGVSVKDAWNVSKSAKAWWRISHSPPIYQAMPVSYFESLGLKTLIQLQST